MKPSGSPGSHSRATTSSRIERGRVGLILMLPGAFALACGVMGCGTWKGLGSRKEQSVAEGKDRSETEGAALPAAPTARPSDFCLR